VETRERPPAIFDQLERLAEVCAAGTDLILLGHHNDVALYRQLTRQGVREYIPMPVDPAHLVEAIVAVSQASDAVGQGRLISFIGASGGAGSSTMAGNIGWCLGKLYDGEAAVVDLDTAFGTLGLYCNLDSPQTVTQALAQADRLDDQMLERFLAKYNDNLSLLTCAGDGSASAEIDSAALDPLLRTLRRNAAWVIADLPRAAGGWVRHVLDVSDEIVITAVPTLASLRNAKSLLDTLNVGRQTDVPVRVILNRVGGQPKTDIPTKDFAATLGHAVSAMVPADAALFARVSNAGQMIGEASKSQRVIDPLNRLTGLVSGRTDAERRRRLNGASLLHKLMPWAA
jgi:pilus assembly protein CpaE